MTDKELMQQALDALDGYARNCRCEGGGAPCDAAEALRARLAQPEQDKRVWCVCGDQIMPDDDEAMCGTCIAFGRAAPPQREWQGLTDEEVIKLGRLDKDSDYFGLWYDFAQAIEAKLKEKNT